MQGADLPEDAPGKGDSGCPARGEPPLWEVRLHTVHLLGEGRETCIPAQGGGWSEDYGQDTEPRVYQGGAGGGGRGAHSV